MNEKIESQGIAEEKGPRSGTPPGPGTDGAAGNEVSAPCPRGDESGRKRWYGTRLETAVRVMDSTTSLLEGFLRYHTWTGRDRHSETLARAAKSLLVAAVRVLAWVPALQKAKDPAEAEKDMQVWHDALDEGWMFMFRRDSGGRLQEVTANRNWTNCSSSPDAESEDEERKDAAWDLAFDAVLGTAGLDCMSHLIEFMRPAHEEFERLLAAGKVREADRVTFMESWGEHNVAFVIHNYDLVDQWEERIPAVPAADAEGAERT